MCQVFFDIEIIGLSSESGDWVIEIGCVELVNRCLIGCNLYFYLNLEWRSYQDAIAVHGLFEEFFVDKLLFAHIADELFEYLKDVEIVIYNVAFDVGFLDVELRRLEWLVFIGHVDWIVDSLSMVWESFLGKSNSLDALCKRFEVNNLVRELYGVLLDAGLLVEVYLRMTRGQNSLVIDVADVFAVDLVARSVDFSLLELIVVVVDEVESAAYEVVLTEIDKVSRGHVVWWPVPLFVLEVMAQ